MTTPYRLITAFLSIAAAWAPAQQTLEIVQIAASGPPALALVLEGAGYDVLGADTTSVRVAASAAEKAALAAAGYAFNVVGAGQPLALALAGSTDGSTPIGYPDLATIQASLAASAAAHPTRCQLVDVTAFVGAPLTEEGRSLFAVKISDNVTVDEDEPACLIVAAHHAREISTPLIALEAIDRLLNDYGLDPQVTALVDDNEIWIAPVWNPDGYEYVFTTDNLWRKNRHVLTTDVGVDQNRNYPMGWNGPCAGSTIEGSQTYKGTAPASEAETQTMMALSTDRQFVKVLDFHSFGRETLWAYRCLAPHPFETFLQAEAAQLSNDAGYLGATRRPSADGEHQEWQLSRGAHAFLIETHTEFQPTFPSAQAEAVQVWPAIKAFLARPFAVSGQVTDAVSGSPVAASIAVLELPFIGGEAGFEADAAFGRYDLVLPDGTWTLAFSAPGHFGQSIPITVTSGSTPVVTVQLAPVPSDSGQANGVDASLALDQSVDWFGQVPLPGQNGPFFRAAAVGDPLTFTFQGQPMQPFVLFVGPLHRNNAVFAGVGSIDIGLGGAIGDFSDLQVAMNGVVPQSFIDLLASLDAGGTQSLTLPTPPLPPGTFGTFQAVIYRAAQPPLLTAATELNLL